MPFDYGRKDITHYPKNYQNVESDRFVRGRVPNIGDQLAEDVIQNDGEAGVIFRNREFGGLVYLMHPSNIELPQRVSAEGTYNFFAPMDINIEPNGKVLVYSGVAVQMQFDRMLMISLPAELPYGLCLAGPTIYYPDYFGSDQDGGQLKIFIKSFRDEETMIARGETLLLGSFVQRLSVPGADRYE